MSGFDFYSIIGRNPDLFRGFVHNVLSNTGLERDQWDFHVIIYVNNKIRKETTEEIISICDDNDIKYVLHPEDPNKPFIERLYTCWNLGYKLGKRDLVLRAGSDQTFSRDSFAMMMDYWNTMPWNDAILQFNTVEQHGPSRHFVEDFGKTFEEYNEKAFQDFVDRRSRHGLFDGAQALKTFGYPSAMIHGKIRPDGCSWLMKRETFKKYIGAMVPIDSLGITGDVRIMDKLQSLGIPQYLMGDCWTYHLVRGESKGFGQ